MKTSIQITAEELITVQQILKRNLPQSAIVWVFGSRAGINIKKFSDLDLAIDDNSPLPYATIVNLKCDFEESDLPFKVDIVDWHQLDQSFQNRINQYRAPKKIAF